MVEHQLTASVLVDGGRVLQHDAQVIGQLGVVEQEAGVGVGLLEPQQSHPALAGVAVGKVGEEQVAAPPAVECLDIAGLGFGERGRLQMFDERAD